ncbi:YebC/PmpR family DNA-binding transcriptional regulator [bacterium]|nr:YebC/PmpR family DNA-binding transcriptional regulator [bacterium]MBU1984476.1 YebC/PmpR family DNA-binding transcriptional regulator [bacterium]
MSGHSKWATIRRKKEKVDAARGQVFTRLIRELTISSRLGGSNPEANARLRSAIDAAKTANMPSDNIDRAIKKGAGELEGQILEEVRYEGYGPGGVAVLVECVTDNRNRTASEVRHVFSKRNGTMAETGAVAWMFDRLGYLSLDKDQGGEEEIMELAIEAGATDVKGDDSIWEVYTTPEELYKVKAELETRGKTVASAEISYIPKNTIKVEADSAKTLLGLIDALEELDDAQNVYSNFEIDDSVMESLS